MFSPSRFPGLTAWLLGDTGTRYFEWFVRSHYKQLLSSRFGASFTEWVFSKIASDNKRSIPPVVVCLYHDGYVRVFSNGVEVKIVNMPRCALNNEHAAEEYLVTTLSHRCLAVYGDDRKVKTGHCDECATVQEIVYAKAFREIG